MLEDVKEKSVIFKGFEPVFNNESRMLILGSFPSVKSRAAGFYYGNKQNRFWKMLETIFDEQIAEDKAGKIQFLLKHKIALYDAVGESDLQGSMDSNLLKSNSKLADMTLLLPPNTNVQKILCNGKAAFELASRNLKTNLPIICMPSTSPANVSYNYKKWNDELKALKNGI